jgi:hypothetical protein
MGAHLEAGVDAESVGGEAVSGEVAPGVEGDAGGEARDQQLGGGRGGVLPAGVGGLVDRQGVAAHRDGEAIASLVLDMDGVLGGPGVVAHRYFLSCGSSLPDTPGGN